MGIKSLKSWWKHAKRRILTLRFLIKSGQSFELIKLETKLVIYHLLFYPLIRVFWSKKKAESLFSSLKRGNEDLILCFPSFADPKIKIPFSDDLLFGEIFLENVYHHEKISKNMVVVDVGAHVGFYSLLASWKVGEKGKVIAIEPDPENFEIF